MPPVPGTIIFSDLDGTFLDPARRPALPPAALARVQSRHRIVWVSSRTASELRHFQLAMGHDEDAIGEAGGIVISRDRSRIAALGPVSRVDDAWVARVGEARETVLTMVTSAFAAHGTTPRTADDLTVDELAVLNGYGPDDARRSRERVASVLLSPAESAAEIAALAALSQQGCRVSRGGRWTIVVRGTDKGASARAWLRTISDAERSSDPATHPRGTTDVVAIGDSDDDEELLRAARRAFVIRTPGRRYPPQLAAIPHAYLLQRFGTAGWVEMLELLDSREPKTA
jgi:predicted mannosyl-3-phosphoglycerate phosphatase (HAD superfamily)